MPAIWLGRNSAPCRQRVFRLRDRNVEQQIADRVPSDTQDPLSPRKNANGIASLGEGLFGFIYAGPTRALSWQLTVLALTDFGSVISARLRAATATRYFRRRHSSASTHSSSAEKLTSSISGASSLWRIGM